MLLVPARDYSIHSHLLVNEEKEHHNLCQGVFVGEVFVCLTDEKKKTILRAVKDPKPSYGYT